MNPSDIDSQNSDDFFASMKAPLNHQQQTDIELISDDEMLDYCFDRIEGHRKYAIRSAILNNPKNAAKWRSINNSLELVEQYNQQKNQQQGLLNKLSQLFNINNKTTWGGLLATGFSILLLVSIMPSSHTIEELTQDGFNNLSGTDLTSIPAIEQQLYQAKSIFKTQKQYIHDKVAAGIRSGFESRVPNTEVWSFWLDELPKDNCDTNCNKTELADYQLGQWLAMNYLICQTQLADKPFINQQLNAWSDLSKNKHPLTKTQLDHNNFCTSIKQLILDATTERK